MGSELPAAIAADEWRVSLTGDTQLLCYRDRIADGIPVLLLHSINAAPSAMEVRPLFDALRAEHPVYAPDLPGFGRSDRAARRYSPEYYAAVINDLLKSMDAGPAHVLALSTSAEFAARAALQEPERFASLCLVSPTGLDRRKPPGGATAEGIHRVLSAPFLGSSIFRLLRTRPSVRFFLGRAFDGSAPKELVDYACLTAAQRGATHAPFRFLSGQLFTQRAVELLYEPLTQPVRVLFDEDPNVGFDRLDEVLEGRANWSATRIPGTRGLPHYERLAETVQALREFWAPLEAH